MTIWKPNKRDFYKNSLQPSIFVPDIYSNSAPDELGVVKLSNDQANDQQKGSKNDTISWENLNKEIEVELKRYMKFEQQKRIGEDKFDTFINADVNINLPKLFPKMEGHIYLRELEAPKKTIPPDLLIVCLKEEVENSKEFINDKWKSQMRSECFDNISQSVMSLFDCLEIRFFSSYFVNMCNILTEFCVKILDRAKSFARPEAIIDGIVCDDDRVLCVNWLLKSLCAAEVTPRIFFIIGFIPVKNYVSKLTREHLLSIVAQIRGVSNAMFSIYLRAFLIYTTSLYLPQFVTDISRACLDDVTQIFFIDDWVNPITALDPNINLIEICNLIAPALKYVMSYALVGTKQKTLNELSNRLQILKSPSIIEAIISCSPPTYIYSRLTDFMININEMNSKNISTASVLTALGVSLCQLKNEGDIKLLNKCWNIIRTYGRVEDYMVCVPSWLEYCISFDQVTLVDTMLGDILKRLNSDLSLCYMYSDEVFKMVQIVCSNIKSVDQLLSLNTLVPLLQSIREQKYLIQACNVIFVFLNEKQKLYHEAWQIVKITDIVKICNSNYSVILSSRSTSDVVVNIEVLTKKISFGDVTSQSLNLMTNYRSSVYRFDRALLAMINGLVVNMLKHQDSIEEKTLSSCLCFCIVTLPTIVNTPGGMDFALSCGNLALKANNLSHAYAFFDLILSQLDSFKQTPTLDIQTYYLSQLLCKFLSCTLVIPDHPDRDILYYFSRLVDFLIKFNQFKVDGLWKSNILSFALEIICAYLQKLSQYTTSTGSTIEMLIAPIDDYRTKLNKLASRILTSINDFMQDPEKKQDLGVRKLIIERIRNASDLEDKACRSYLYELRNLSA